MNTAQDTTIDANREEYVPTPRDTITKHITLSKMPLAAKKMAAKLLAKNQTPGTLFLVTMGELRSLCHAATNLDVIKHLRHLRAAGLVEYVIFFGPQKVEMRFIVP